jgi:GGDEF domain-containing protein
MAERLRANLGLRAETSGLPFRLKASIGTALVQPTGPESLQDLLAEADARMYEAKRASRSARAS